MSLAVRIERGLLFHLVEAYGLALLDWSDNDGLIMKNIWCFVCVLVLLSGCMTTAPLIEREPKEQAPAAVEVQNPAVVALLAAADTASRADNHQGAVAKLERALRIAPKNGNIWYQLAEVKFIQAKYRQAENFALRANSVAQSHTLRRRAWLLVAKAREQQGDTAGAALARDHAQRYVRKAPRYECSRNIACH